MRNRNANLVLFTLLLVLLFAFFKWRNLEYRHKEPVNRDADSLIYSAQAQCWMQCQEISRADVEQVLRLGIIIYSSSRLFKGPCPQIVMRGYDTHHQSIELILQQCNQKAVLLKTAFLKTNKNCSCP
jgi:hypothetical protein